MHASAYNAQQAIDVVQLSAMWVCQLRLQVTLTASQHAWCVSLTCTADQPEMCTNTCPLDSNKQGLRLTASVDAGGIALSLTGVVLVSRPPFIFGNSHAWTHQQVVGEACSTTLRQ